MIAPVPAAPSAAQVLRQAADLIEQRVVSATSLTVDPWGSAVLRESLVPWVALMSPQLAAPLAAWLRAEADCIDQTADVTEHMPKLAEAIEENMTRTKPRKYEMRVSISTADQALALATAILGEES